MGTQIRVKMEELQSIFAETKNALAGGHGSALAGREAVDPARKHHSAIHAFSEGEISWCGDCFVPRHAIESK